MYTHTHTHTHMHSHTQEVSLPLYNMQNWQFVCMHKVHVQVHECVLTAPLLSFIDGIRPLTKL